MATSKVSRENFILIQGWMITDLKLKGNELVIYACIYGFSQAENQTFSGSLQYLADWTNSTKQGVINCLKSLVKKGFLVKKENVINGVKFCEYYATKFNGVCNKVEQGIQQSLMGGIQQSLPNNIAIDNIVNNIEDNIGCQPEADEPEHPPSDVKGKKGKKTKKPEPEKKAYGEFNNVLLADEELEKLKSKFSDYQERIENLSAGIESKGYKYKSHYATILSWAKKDKDKPARKEPTPSWMTKGAKNYNSYPQRQYSAEELDELEGKLLGVKTAGTDPEIAARAEALKQQLS